MENKQIIISIGRECGCGGGEIGQMIADHYGIKLYDKNVIDLLAEKTNQSAEELMKLDEKVTGHLFPGQKDGFAAHEDELMNRYSKSDMMFLREKALIRDLAKQESFVILGRAANSILADVPYALRLFIYASDEFKIPRVREFYHLDSDKEAEKKMEQIDKARRDYFHYYTNMVWGSKDGHDFSIDSSVFGLEGTAQIIIMLAQQKLAGQK